MNPPKSLMDGDFRCKKTMPGAASKEQAQQRRARWHAVRGGVGRKDASQITPWLTLRDTAPAMLHNRRADAQLRPGSRWSTGHPAWIKV
jgi:hypothetical protein